MAIVLHWGFHYLGKLTSLTFCFITYDAEIYRTIFQSFFFFFFLRVKLNNSDLTQCEDIGRTINICKAITFISLWGFPSGSVCKELTCKAGDLQEMWVWSLGLVDPLEEEMENHSNVLAWEIPWTEEPGGLQFMRLHKSWTQVSEQTANTTAYTLLLPYTLMYSQFLKIRM